MRVSHIHLNLIENCLRQDDLGIYLYAYLNVVDTEEKDILTKIVPIEDQLENIKKTKDWSIKKIKINTIIESIEKIYLVNNKNKGILDEKIKVFEDLLEESRCDQDLNFDVRYHYAKNLRRINEEEKAKEIYEELIAKGSNLYFIRAILNCN